MEIFVLPLILLIFTLDQKIKADTLKKILLFFLAHVFTLIQLNAQDTTLNTIEGILLPYFGQNLRYVDESKIGLSVLNWKVKNGKIYDERVINPLSKKVEKEIMRVLYLTKGKWIKTNDEAIFYCPIRFKMNGHDFFSNELPSSINGNILKEVTVVRYGHNKNFKNDQDLVDKLNKNLSKAKYKKCIDLTDELLRRNPFSFQIREIRIKCLNEIGEFQSACDDIDFIEKYLSQKSKSTCKAN